MTLNDRLAASPESRFWSRVDKSAGDDGCWLWTAARTRGYGKININGLAGGRKGVPQWTHRVAWILTNGPTDLCVLHACDNPPCCNPAHLFLGTRQDNAADRDAKGRTFNGNAAKTHCKHGHEFTDENTFRFRNGTQRGCKACRRNYRYVPAPVTTEQDHEDQDDLARVDTSEGQPFLLTAPTVTDGL